MGDSHSVIDGQDEDVTRERALFGDEPTSGPTFPLVEAFGPTIQGEGPDAGLPVYFLRFGLCDYRCSWCDSMYAVDPQQLRDANVERLDAPSILARLDALLPGAGMVVLSGGNPAVHDLGDVVLGIKARGLWCAVETQGSIWRPWLATVDRLVVSPKPPSSGMVSPRHYAEHTRFLERAAGARATITLKYVVFDDVDLQWAIDQANGKPCFLSVGTDPGATTGQILDRYTWLCERVCELGLAKVKVLPQLHVLAWGHARGV